MKFLHQTFLIALGSASLTWAVPAAAFTITTGGTPVLNEGQYTSVAGATTVNFNNPPPSGGLPTSPVYTSVVNPPAVVVGNSPGEYASPTGDTSPFLTISPAGGSIPVNRGGTGPVTINFSGVGGGLMNYFGLYWGTVDSYNSIAFFNGATQIGSTVSGSAIGVPPNTTVYVNFTFTNAEAFNRVVLTSSQAAFESDNHAYREVPVPPAWLGILLTGGISAIQGLKRQQQQS
ncbi:MAG: hypothetical protein KME35_05425 [Aphanocapsa sp. GSE-SYN-MK-11-07L]|jgi:hypothetical protein|nr:hypothetical protein [Aphanocapsa sp. GSE-SYN-MK-11-07L]